MIGIRNAIAAIGLIGFWQILSACAPFGAAVAPALGGAGNQASSLADGFVVKSTFAAALSADAGGARIQSLASTARATVSGNPVDIPISVTSSPSVTMVTDASGFAAPPLTNAILNFGRINVTALDDNALRVCGPSGAAKCSSAAIRIYTTGPAGAGLYNAQGGYGAPITATLAAPGAAAQTVGLGAANAAVMQTFAIPAARNVVLLSDFLAAPSYSFQIDFSNAGAGSYATTLVIEYGLLP